MEIVRITTSKGRPSIEKFFMDYFYADYLEDPSDTEAALAEYLESEKPDDPTGSILCAEAEALLARNLSDDDLSALIEGWEPNIYLSRRGMSYKPVLRQISAYLKGVS